MTESKISNVLLLVIYNRFNFATNQFIWFGCSSTCEETFKLNSGTYYCRIQLWSESLTVRLSYILSYVSVVPDY